MKDQFWKIWLSTAWHWALILHLLFNQKRKYFDEQIFRVKFYTVQHFSNFNNTFDLIVVLNRATEKLAQIADRAQKFMEFKIFILEINKFI